MSTSLQANPRPVARFSTSSCEALNVVPRFLAAARQSALSLPSPYTAGWLHRPSLEDYLLIHLQMTANLLLGNLHTCEQPYGRAG